MVWVWLRLKFSYDLITILTYRQPIVQLFETAKDLGWVDWLEQAPASLHFVLLTVQRLSFCKHITLFWVWFFIQRLFRLESVVYKRKRVIMMREIYLFWIFSAFLSLTALKPFQNSCEKHLCRCICQIGKNSISKVFTRSGGINGTASFAAVAVNLLIFSYYRLSKCLFLLLQRHLINLS